MRILDVEGLRLFVYLDKFLDQGSQGFPDWPVLARQVGKELGPHAVEARVVAVEGGHEQVVLVFEIGIEAADGESRPPRHLDRRRFIVAPLAEELVGRFDQLLFLVEAPVACGASTREREADQSTSSSCLHL